MGGVLKFLQDKIRTKHRKPIGMTAQECLVAISDKYRDRTIMPRWNSLGHPRHYTKAISRVTLMANSKQGEVRAPPSLLWRCPKPRKDRNGYAAPVLLSRYRVCCAPFGAVKSNRFIIIPVRIFREIFLAAGSCQGCVRCSASP